MQEASDTELLRQYVHLNSQEAFATLVTRHVNMVCSAALRKTGNAAAAEEITQAVFIILAQKASRLSATTIISGWLYQTMRWTASNFLRTEIRRARREQEASMQSLSNQDESEIWPQIMPLLEDAMGRLGEKDRNALALRFFEEKSFVEIGLAFGATENAAKKRVARALIKLRHYFSRHGVHSTPEIIARTILANSIHAAPAALANSITAVALAKGATAPTSTLTLIKGALKIMAWSKVKTVAVAGAVVLLATGTTTITIKEIQGHKAYPWQSRSFRDFKELPPQVTIVPTKFVNASKDDWPGFSAEDGSFYWGLNYPIAGILETAFGMKPCRTIVSLEVPKDRYDFVANLASGNKQALMEHVSRQLGVIGVIETREERALILRSEGSGAMGMKESAHRQGFDPPFTWNFGLVVAKGARMSELTSFLEDQYQTPVVDETGLNGYYDYTLKWDQSGWQANRAGLKQALLNQLGLELVPTNIPIEMLVVEKSK
jgi:RNA polymerase sigma factor (sigma-70 family)